MHDSCAILRPIRRRPRRLLHWRRKRKQQACHGLRRRSGCSHRFGVNTSPLAYEPPFNSLDIRVPIYEGTNVM
jgi:hypothetical protein